MQIKYLDDLKVEVQKENKSYFEQKARDIIRKQKDSKFYQIQLRLLVSLVPELKETKEFIDAVA